MNRRGLLTSSLAALVASAPRDAMALGQCGWIAPGVQQCVVGLQSQLVDEVADRQHATEWCWAASLAMVFGYFGHAVAQEDIVQQTWGDIVNMPGQPGQILADLNRSWTDENGQQFSVRGDVFSANVVTAAQDLASDQPLLIGSLGHCMVLTALTYVQDVYGRWQIQAATVRDPWPFNPGQRYLTPQEWFSTSFLARVRVFNN